MLDKFVLSQKGVKSIVGAAGSGVGIANGVGIPTASSALPDGGSVGVGGGVGVCAVAVPAAIKNRAMIVIAENNFNCFIIQKMGLARSAF